MMAMPCRRSRSRRERLEVRVRIGTSKPLPPNVLASCPTISLEKLNLYTAVQIEGMRRSARLFATKGEKVETLLPSYLVFPVALNRIETLLSQQLDPSYEAFEMFLNAIVPQMFSTLDAVTFRDDPAFTDGNFDVLPARDSDF